MREYSSSANVPPKALRPVSPAPGTHQITAETHLVSIEGAIEALKRDKGLSLSADTVRHYCRNKWQKGTHWIKPQKHYLINLAAIYEWLVTAGE